MCSHLNRVIEAILMSTHNIPFFQYKHNKNHHKLSQICSYGIFSKGLKNEFEKAVVNESSCSSLSSTVIVLLSII